MFTLESLILIFFFNQTIGKQGYDFTVRDQEPSVDKNDILAFDLRHA